MEGTGPCNGYQPGEVLNVELGDSSVGVTILEIAELKQYHGRDTGGYCAVEEMVRRTGEKYLKAAYAREKGLGRNPANGGERGAGEQLFSCLCGLCGKNIRLRSKVVLSKTEAAAEKVVV
jgi:hypothetical protein